MQRNQYSVYNLWSVLLVVSSKQEGRYHQTTFRLTRFIRLFHQKITGVELLSVSQVSFKTVRVPYHVHTHSFIKDKRFLQLTDESTLSFVLVQTGSVVQ